jgi:lipid-A-disaccharide synthase
LRTGRSTARTESSLEPGSWVRPLRILISCAEASGDLYAGALAAELRRGEPGIEIAGLGGPHLRAAGARLLGDFSALAVTGMTGALRVVPRSIALLRLLAAEARVQRPDVVVLVDAPDFNFPLMWMLRRLGVPVVYYISPQLWAWRRGRIDTMRRRAARVLVIFPFEEKIYRDAGVPVEFVGHPLVDMAAPSETRTAFLRRHGLDPSAPTVALLPGSRRNELHRIAPAMAAALPLIRARVPRVQFVIAGAPGLPDSIFAPLLERPPEGGGDFGGPPEGGPYTDGRPVLIRERTNDVLHACDVAITASGTATVQCVLHERPMVVVYRVSGLDYWLAKRFVTLKDVAMPNVLAGRRIVPELIQRDLTPENVAAETAALLSDRAHYDAMKMELRRIREQLGTTGATARAAEAVRRVARGGATP